MPLGDHRSSMTGIHERLHVARSGRYTIERDLGAWWNGDGMPCARRVALWGEPLTAPLEPLSAALTDRYLLSSVRVKTSER